MNKILLSSIVLAAIFSGCGDSSSCCNAAGSQNLGNSSASISPVAVITGLADNTTITTGESVSVNGSSSSDRDGTVSTYNWDIDGLSTSTAIDPTFTFDTVGDHEICLTVTDNDNLNSTNIACKTVKVEAPVVADTPVVPTAVITLTDSDAPLVLYSQHTFSCADSHDNDTLGTGAEIVSCDWNIQSYRIDSNGNEIPYRTCTSQAMDGKPVLICGSVVRIVAKLTVTDNDGQTASTTTEYTEFSAN